MDDKKELSLVKFYNKIQSIINTFHFNSFFNRLKHSEIDQAALPVPAFGGYSPLSPSELTQVHLG